MKVTLAIPVLTLLIAGCTSTSTRALIGDPKLPPMPDVGFKMVGPVSGDGSAMTICPGIQKLFGAKDTTQRAEEDAVGQAIFERNDVDLVIAPKTKISYLSVLGLFDQAKVTVKGQGVKLEK